MRARLLSLAVLLFLPWLVPACRPTKGELASMQAQLAQMETQQQVLEDRMQQLEERNATEGEQAQGERDLIEGIVVDVSKRLDVLEKAATKRRAPRPGSPDPEAVYRVTIGDSPTKGPADALVTIVMWTDYQCPYCARVQSTMHELESTYGRELRFVHKHNPLGFHPRAMPAALAAEAAGRQGKFWEMNDLLFGNNKALSDGDLRRYAKKLELQMRRFDKDVEDPALRARIEDDQKHGMTLGARGTPAFFINGRFLSGAQPFESFRQLIDEELVKARALVDRGVPREKVYEVTIAEGRTSV